MFLINRCRCLTAPAGTDRKCVIDVSAAERLVAPLGHLFEIIDRIPHPWAELPLSSYLSLLAVLPLRKGILLSESASAFPELACILTLRAFRRVDGVELANLEKGHPIGPVLLTRPDCLSR